jgi:hypothetical protein
MGGRYLVRGTTIGILRAFIESDKMQEALDTLDKVEEDNYLFESNDTIEEDMAQIKQIFKNEEETP